MDIPANSTATPATSIDEVIQQLDAVIAFARRTNSRLGFFPALYREVTLRVKEGIATGQFDNGDRMEKLDVRFANRYLMALRQFRDGQTPTESWRVAFDSAKRWRLLILQHLLLGMNAHINLDLGIAAAQTAPGIALPEIKNDFDKINDILAALLDGVQDKIAELSPWFKWLDSVGGRTDEFIMNFSIQRARDAAWNFALTLAALDTPEQDDRIREKDRQVANLGRSICHPGKIISLVAFFIRIFESSDVDRIIDVLFRTD